MDVLLAPAEFEERLRQVGAERYHHRHPFHRLLHEGRLDRGQLQAWALNRHYYQSRLPMKDAALMARMEDRALRHVWRQRLLDQDGERPEDGGIMRWLALTDGLGLARDDVVSGAGVLPATRFAVDAYVRFVGERSVLEGVASSLTELFAPALMAERMAAMLRRYDFIPPAALAYFEQRLGEAPRDAAFALDYVTREARRPDQQRAAIQALAFKCDVLWALLDAVHHAYVAPGHAPPGAFTP